MGRFESWLKKHSSFDLYKKITAKYLQFHRWLLLAKYFVFTRKGEGVFLRETIGRQSHGIWLNAISSALPYLVVLILLACAPLFLNIPESWFLVDDAAAVAAGFIAATLAIAGIFLTLFYTNAATVFSSKYPSGNDTLSNLFVALLSSDKDLRYCGAFVVTVSAAFIALGFGRLNILVVVYIFALLIALISKLPGILRLLTEKTSFAAIALKPVNRFLLLAYAASYKRHFYESSILISNFRKIAQSDLSTLNCLMDYALSMESGVGTYAKTLADVLLDMIAGYSRVIKFIPIDSRWHMEKRVHNSWFMSAFFEVSIAMDTGTIPHPKASIDMQGYQEEIFTICLRYQEYLMQQQDVDNLIEWCIKVNQMFGDCLKYGDAEWIKRCALPYLKQFRSFLVKLSNCNCDAVQLRKYCQLFEIYSMMFATIPLGLLRLCTNADPDVFRFDCFSVFDQKELQSKGFPLSESEELKSLWAKMNYEIRISGHANTPSWCFNRDVERIGRKAIISFLDFVSNVYNEFLDATQSFVQNKSYACYVLVLREGEISRKVLLCLEALERFAQVSFGGVEQCETLLAEAKDGHYDFAKLLPRVVASFVGDREELEGILPDVYGFAFFNYCQFLYEKILARDLTCFVDAIKPLYGMVAIVSSGLNDALEKGSYSDIYKGQIMSEPTLFLFELCGMAYCMAELLDLPAIQDAIKEKLAEILAGNSTEKIRWSACLKLAKDAWLNSKISSDVDSWRRGFLSAISENGLYPKVLQETFMRPRQELNEKERRIKKMLPSIHSIYGRFNGCAICWEYLLEGEIENGY